MDLLTIQPQTVKQPTLKKNNIMENNQLFSIQRIGLLLKRDLNQRGWLIGIIMLIFFTIWVINALIQMTTNEHGVLHFEQFSLWLFVGGIIISSLSFLEMSNPLSRQFYLHLPASTLEKYVSRWLLTGLGYTIALIILYWLFSLFATWVGYSFFDYQLNAFTPFKGQNWIVIKVFLAIQTIFLAGAATFKRFALFKTLFSVLILGAIIGIIGLTAFRLIMYDLFEGIHHFRPMMELNGHEIMVEPSRKFIEFTKNNFPFYSQLIGFGILTPLVIIFGYFKLKEQEF